VPRKQDHAGHTYCVTLRHTPCPIAFSARAKCTKMSRPAKRRRIGEPSIVDLAARKLALDRLRREIDRSLTRAAPYIVVVGFEIWGETAERLARGSQYCEEWGAVVGALQGELEQDLRAPLARAQEFLSAGEALVLQMARTGWVLREVTQHLRLQRSYPEPNSSAEEAVDAFDALREWLQQPDVDNAFIELEVCLLEAVQTNPDGQQPTNAAAPRPLAGLQLFLLRPSTQCVQASGRQAVKRRYKSLLQWLPCVCVCACMCRIV